MTVMPAQSPPVPCPLTEIGGRLAQLHESIPQLADREVEQQVQAVEALSRMTHALGLELVAELQSRNLAAAAGFGSTKRMLAAMLSLSQAEARARVVHAEHVARRRGLTGEQLPPQCAATAAGLTAGEIGIGQLRVIAAAMTALPDSTGLADRDWAEAHLAQWAPRLDPTALGRLAAHVLAALDPDGPEPAAEDRPAPSGALRLRDRRNGGVGFEGYLDHEHGPAFKELIDRLAAPRPAAEGIPDPRETEERQADALIELCELARSAPDAPDGAGEPPHLTITMDLNMLRDGIGAAALDYGTYLSASEARRWACEAKVIPAVLGGKTEPLDVGRAMRTVPAAVRRALVVRDKGCAFPGCGRPPSRCSAHHRKHWIDGGETSVENCCLLCEYHHRMVHHTGWEITIHPDRVDFIPPAVIDPLRRPLCNPLRC